MKRDATIVAVVLVAAGIAIVAKGAIKSSSVVLLVAVVPSIILHEISHGVVALWFGDDTAKRAGRLTLNPDQAHRPVRDHHPPRCCSSLSGLGAFGYAKPVPVNPSQLRHPRNDGLVVSLAGPVTNILLCLVTRRLGQGDAPVVPGVRRRAARRPVPLCVRLRQRAAGRVQPAAHPAARRLGHGRADHARSWWPGWLKLRQYSMPVLLLIVLLLPDELGAGLQSGRAALAPCPRVPRRLMAGGFGSCATWPAGSPARCRRPGRRRGGGVGRVHLPAGRARRCGPGCRGRTVATRSGSPVGSRPLWAARIGPAGRCWPPPCSTTSARSKPGSGPSAGPARPLLAMVAGPGPRRRLAGPGRALPAPRSAGRRSARRPRAATP